MPSMSDCIFCRIVKGEIAADRLYEDDLVIAILDINPRAPIHFMVIPREHIADARQIKGEHGPLLSRMFAVSTKVAKDEGVAESGYRLAFNVGPAAGMTVDHLHMHCLGGRELGPEG
jgi:histidine triad (HIT) family protein